LKVTVLISSGFIVAVIFWLNKVKEKLFCGLLNETEKEVLVTGFIGRWSYAIIKTVIYNDILSGDEAFMLHARQNKF
jgi:hypothetical protein